MTNALRKYADKDQFGIQVITGKNKGGQWYGNQLNISQDMNNADYGSVIAPDDKIGSINQTMSEKIINTLILAVSLRRLSLKTDPMWSEV